jgi:hypothetical protein
MGFKVKAGVSLGLVMLLVALASTGCGDSSSSKPTASPAGPALSPSASTSSGGGQQAAKAYFAAMAPAIDKDYQGLQWFKQAMTEWQQTYANTDPSTNRQAWNALGLILQQALSKEQEITKGYEAIAPPKAFRTAHATLVKNNRDGIAWAEDLITAIKASRPMGGLMSTLEAGPPGPSNSEVLAEFQDAAARFGIALPRKLIEAYSDVTDSGGQTV